MINQEGKILNAEIQQAGLRPCLVKSKHKNLLTFFTSTSGGHARVGKSMFNLSSTLACPRKYILMNYLACSVKHCRI